MATLPRTVLYADLGHCIREAVRGSTAIDVGASVGNYALAMSRAVGRHGRVLALEANPAVFAELVSSTWASRVTPLNLAASSSSGWADMLVPQDGRERHEPLATLEPRPGTAGTTVPVRCIRLDDLADAARRVSLVKIDVEGHEADVLAGAEEIIARDAPTFVIEIERRHLVGRDVADVVTFLLDRGYTCAAIQGSRLIPWEEFDVDRLQTAALESGADAAQQADYVNNFLFRARR